VLREPLAPADLPELLETLRDPLEPPKAAVAMPRTGERCLEDAKECEEEEESGRCHRRRPLSGELRAIASGSELGGGAGGAGRVERVSHGVE
jgi:hypothetical protein